MKISTLGRKNVTVREVQNHRAMPRQYVFETLGDLLDDLVTDELFNDTVLLGVVDPSMSIGSRPLLDGGLPPYSDGKAECNAESFRYATRQAS
jgi:hypothetical protein